MGSLVDAVKRAKDRDPEIPVPGRVMESDKTGSKQKLDSAVNAINVPRLNSIKEAVDKRKKMLDDI